MRVFTAKVRVIVQRKGFLLLHGNVSSMIVHIIFKLLPVRIFPFNQLFPNILLNTDFLVNAFLLNVLLACLVHLRQGIST